MQHRTDFSQNPALIKVIGVGGCGGNAVNRMVRCGLTGIEFIAMNTDVQALRASEANVKMQLGKELLKGLGSGGDPEKGRQAAIESKERIKEVLTGSDMVFITAGMGGGTGTGGAPVIAEIAKGLDILTVGVVTTPFDFELHVKKQQALNGINELKKHVDTLILIPNNKVFVVFDEKTPLEIAFQMVDDVLRQAVQSVTEIITKSGNINRDFNDVRRILKNAGEALIGIGEAGGEDRAKIACRKAMENPLLENYSIDGAKKILVNITTSKNSAFIGELNEAMTLIQDAVASDAELFLGTVEDDAMEDRMKITIVASGLTPFKSKKMPSAGTALQKGQKEQKKINIFDIPPYLKRKWQSK